MEMANDSLDRRLTPRYIISRLVRVIDISTQQELGRIVNLSSSGFMLVSSQPIESRKTLHLALELGTTAESSRRVRLEAQCLWCGPSSFSLDYGAGFEITYIAPTEQRKLQQWIGVAAGAVF